MSASIDDLVASLSANHIGQDAIDLAALQAQLAQTLLTHQLSISSPHSHSSPFLHSVSLNIVRRDPSNVQHCTTPTARTPSSATFTWPLPAPEHAEHSRKRSTSFARRRGSDDSWCDFQDIDDEERMVEDMVTPDSPCSPHAYLWSPYKNDVHCPATTVLSSPASMSMSSSTLGSPTDSCTSSLFTSTDPFYLQTSQSSQQSHTFFSHVGRASSHSSFMMGVPSWE